MKFYNLWFCRKRS